MSGACLPIFNIFRDIAREFVIGVLLVPVAFTFVWMTVFGNTALSLDMGTAKGAIAAAVNADVATALFQFLEYLPLPAITSAVATLLVVTFFVTSSNSGSLVFDIITSGGATNSPVWQRVFWALSEGLVAAVLLLAGGLGALQTASIAAALPFVLVMLVVCLGLVRGLRMEGVRQTSLELPSVQHVHGRSLPWQKRLRSLIHFPDRESVSTFLQNTVKPALDEIGAEIRQTGLKSQVDASADEVKLTVYHGKEREFLYAVRLQDYRAPTFAFPEFTKPDEPVGPLYYRAEVHLLEGSQHYDLMNDSKQDIIGDVMAQYEKHMHFLHSVRSSA